MSRLGSFVSSTPISADASTYRPTAVRWMASGTFAAPASVVSAA
jgi:hypothetical protein